MVTARKVIPIKPQITAWSYSRLNDYRKCPAFAKYKHVDRIKEPGNKAMARGSDIHAEAQVFARAKPRVKCPETLSCFEQEFREVQKLKLVLTEQQWAFTKDWKLTGWFDDDVRVRNVVDLAFVKPTDNILYIVDHKTGKLNPDHLGQLSLYALCGLLLYPEVAGVNVQLWYLDQGVIMPEQAKIYTHADIPALKKEWEARAKPMLADRRFPPKPSSNCSWCFFSKAKNGPCKF